MKERDCHRIYEEVTDVGFAMAAPEVLGYFFSTEVQFLVRSNPARNEAPVPWCQ